MTFSRFLQDIRLEAAAKLLRGTERTINDVASASGYENMSYFYKIFYEKYQMKPADLRRAKKVGIG
jgi:transcriptional regulator GlxA family with amidase domain